METLETCLGHVIGRCPDCKSDKKNKECPNYKPLKIRIFEVKESSHYSEQTPS
ncbi:MAG: hypothetical protein KKF50_02485 [Nanoarchaeota archaeon]|nr:hypothetical protein [Nanoarchaeota archaeon]